MLEIFAHPDLPHQLVLVTVHASELANVSEDILHSIGELESVDISQAILDVGVDNQLRQTKDLEEKHFKFEMAEKFTALTKTKVTSNSSRMHVTQ